MPSSRPIARSPLRGSRATFGAHRQNVQRIINELHEEGLLAFETNPHHRRAQLVVLTDKGKRAFFAAMNLQAPWVNSLADGLSVKEIQTVHRIVGAVRKKLKIWTRPANRRDHETARPGVPLARDATRFCRELSC